MTDYLHQFEQHLTTERNLSGHTVAAYLRDLQRFEMFFTGAGLVHPQRAWAGADRLFVVAAISRPAAQS